MRFLAPLALVLAAAPAHAVPSLLAYQGRLLNADGTPASGIQTMGFALYASPTGGSALWSETQQVLLSDGFYALVLGDRTDGGLPAVFDGSERYLELSVGGTPLTPRQRIDSVAYALHANTAANVSGGTVDASSVKVNGTPVVTAVGAARPLTSSGGSTPTIGLTACAAGQVLGYDGSSWGCVTPAVNAPYGGGAGVSVNGSTISLAACPAGEVWKSLSPGWSCMPDDDTTYSAGAGLSLNGTTFSVDTSRIQARVKGTCSVGTYVQAIYPDGGMSCATDRNSGGTVTSVATGPGLTGGPITGSGTISLSSVVQMFHSYNHSYGYCPGGMHFIGAIGSIANTATADDNTWRFDQENVWWCSY